MSKAPAPSDLADKFMLRFPEGMRDQIASAAKANGRSMNAEIVQRLQDSFDPDVERFLYNAGVQTGSATGALAVILNEIKALRFELAGARADQDYVDETDSTP